MTAIRVFGLICFLAIVGFGQRADPIRGTVRDARGPVKGAVVTLIRDGETTARYTKETDSAGAFSFDAAPGSYTLKATASIDGKLFSSSSSVEARVGGSEVRDLTLTEASEIRESVTVSAGVSQTLDEVSKTVDVIDAQQMRDRADFALIESLRTIPGFRVQQSGGFGRLATVKTRGLRNQDTAMLIDGIRFRDGSAITGDASPFISDFTLTSVDRVEVLRGSDSSLYGTNAIGGVIDFQTPSARQGTHGQVGGAFGGLGLGRFRGNVSHGTGGGRFGIGAGVSRTVYTKGIDGQDDAHNTNFQSRVDIHPFAATHVSGRLFFSNADVRLNTNPNTLGSLPVSNAGVIDAIAGVNFSPDINDPDSFQRSRFFSGHAAVEHAFNDEVLLSGSYQGLKTVRRNTNGPLGVGFQPFSGAAETDRFAGFIHTLNGRLTFTPNRVSRTTAGYEFEAERFENDHITIVVPDNFGVRARQSSHTLFAQQLLSLVDGRLQIAGGFRAQFFSLKQPTFRPVDNPAYDNLQLENPPSAYTADGSVSYLFHSTGTKLRAHVGNGYRVPSLYERFGTFYSGFFGYSNSGDPNLSPERSIAADAGIEQTFLSNRVRLTGTYFYTDVTTAIDFAFCVPQCLPGPDPFGRFGGYYNTDGRLARGLETSADINPTRSTRIFTSYTFTNSDERTPLNLFIRTSPGIPSHQFSLVATQRIKRFWVNFDFVATSTYLFPFYNFNGATFEEKYYMYRFKGSRRGDLTAGYTFGLGRDGMSLRVHGTVENVFGYEYYENGFRTIGATARAGVSFGF